MAECLHAKRGRTTETKEGHRHKPLLQRMALLRPAGAAAERFYAYMQASPAREVMRRYGFVLPGEVQ